MSIKLEVSLGEALDKLSILEIKKKKITDSRINDVMIEHKYLFEELEKYVIKYQYLYKILYMTNNKIWELMDIIRNNLDLNDFYKYCDETIQLNDSRFLIKKKINELENCNLKEQKGYKIRKLFIIINCEYMIISIITSAIRYYSFFYDEIYLLVDNIENNLFLSTEFNDDKSIIVSKNFKQYINDDRIIINNENDIDLLLSHNYFTKIGKKINNEYDENNIISKIYNSLNLEINVYYDYKK